jgi:hypothetical protein
MNFIGLARATITLSSDVGVDVIASWKENDNPQSTGANVHATGTSEQNIMAAGVGGRVRRLTDLHCRSLAANTGNVTVTIKQNDGTNSFEVMSAALMPGDVLVYDHQRSWHVVCQATLGAAGLDVLKMIYPNTILADSPSHLV